MDIQAQISFLQTMRPQLTMQQLLDLKQPEADFEFSSGDRWFYSVKERGYMGPGSLLEGNLICVRASSPLKAEQLAQEGLQASINEFSAYLNAGPQVVADTLPASH